MKTLLVSIFLVVASFTNLIGQETETMTGTFNGYEDGVFNFTDTDGYSMEFNHISNEAKAMIDLTQDQYIGKLFQVTFTSETEVDDEDEEMTSNTIVGIKVIE
jgi:hypothetical protein